MHIKLDAYSEFMLLQPNLLLQIMWFAPGGASPGKSGVASSRAKIFEDPNCVDAWL